MFIILKNSDNQDIVFNLKNINSIFETTYGCLVRTNDMKETPVKNSLKEVTKLISKKYDIL
jgi:hypothetical protein